MKPRLNNIFALCCALAAGYFFYTYAAGRDNFFTRHVQYQREHAQAKIKLIQLNYLIPSFKNMADFARGENAPADIDWNQYIPYFEKVAELMPQRWDVYVFLGHCYYHQKRKDLATVSFQKAVLLNPPSFWAYYDLGVLAAQEGNCPAAAAGLAQALAISPQAAAQSMYASKLYLDVRAAAADFDRLAEQHLKEGYLSAYRLGTLAARCAQGTADARQLQDLRALALDAPVQVF